MHGHLCRTYPVLGDLEVQDIRIASRAEECLDAAVLHYIGCLLGAEALVNPDLLLEILSSYLIVGMDIEGTTTVIAH